MITLHEVTKSFNDGGTEKVVLKPTSLTIRKGEFVAIVGPSGSGKSTLLTIIGALQKPNSGSLIINQNNVYTLNEKQRSSLRFSTLGFVLQSSNLVPYLTIKEQFILKIKQFKAEVSMSKIDEVLDILSIESIKDKYPDEVSGGERQRAAIGLALILDPPILLTDEPTASLDTDKAYQVVEMLRHISKDRETSVVMVTHDTRMLSYCDRVFEMSDGVLREASTEISL